jgi:hypothetical protein
MLEGLAKLMPLIMVVGFLVLAYLTYMQYNNMKEVYAIVQAMQQQLATIAPSVDANSIAGAVIYR